MSNPSTPSNISKLNLVPLKARMAMTPQEARRQKLLIKLQEQLSLAEAEAAGRKHVVMKQAVTRDNDGNKTRVEREKRIKAWWWKDGDGLAMTIKYGSRVLELAKGKRALRVDSITAVPATIRIAMEAVKSGELDGAIDAVLNASKAKQGRG